MDLHKPEKPSVGRTVLFRSTDPLQMGDHSSAPEVPATITNVWSDTCVNLMVMRDGHNATPIGVTSVLFAEPKDAAGQSCSWRWPPRI